MDEELPRAKFLRLKNGDDIISEMIELTDDEISLYMLINPLKVAYVASQHEGYLQVSFLPWVFSSICDHQEFTIQADDVLMISDVSDKMNDYYWTNLEAVETETPKSMQQDNYDKVSDEDLEKLQQIIDTVSGIKRTFH